MAIQSPEVFKPFQQDMLMAPQRSAFGIDNPVFGDAMGQEVLGIMNARDNARRMSEEFTSRVFGRGQGLDRERGEGGRRRREERRRGETPETPVTPEEPTYVPASSAPRAPARVMSAAPLAPGLRARTRPQLYTIAGSA